MIKTNPFTAACHAMALWVLPATLLLSACQSKPMGAEGVLTPGSELAETTQSSAVTLRLATADAAAPANAPGGKRFDAATDPQIKDIFLAGSPNEIAVQIAVYSKSQARWAYSKLTPFTRQADGTYLAKPIKVPTGQCEFYALYVANPTPATAKVEYFTPKGQKKALDWDFNATTATNLPMEEVVNSVIPVTLKENDASYSLLEDKPVTVTPENTLAETELAKIAWEDLTTHPWVDKPHKGALPHRSPLSGKTIAQVDAQSGTQPAAPQEVSVALKRDYVRLKFFIGSATATTGGSFVVEKMAFINMPTATAPLFRTAGDNLDKKFTANEKAGIYSYGYNFKYRNFSNFTMSAIGKIPQVPKEGNEPAPFKMVENEKHEYILPQYVAPYLPEVNSWQKSQPHPKVLLRVRFYSGDVMRETETIRDFLVDVGEYNTATQAYDGALLPGRDYNVFLMLPDTPDKELFLTVLPYGAPIEVDIPVFD